LNERHKDKTVRKIIIRMGIIFLVAISILVFMGYRYITQGLNPIDAESEEVIEIEIPSGSTRRDIANILEKNELINSSLIFDFYVRFSEETHFQAGTYLMSPSMSVKEIVSYLNEGGTPIMDQPIFSLTIPEGFNIEEIAERMDEKTDFSRDEFMDLIQNDEFVEQMGEKYPDLLKDALAAEETRYVLEGYLFPATYDIFEETTLEDTVEQMISRMNQVVQPYLEVISERNLNVHEILTLASYIEKEGVSEEDRELISGVFYNRLEEGMLLQTDPSVSYALGEHRESTTYKDLEVDSPYNTYKYSGIGAGPIGSPSKGAIEASVYPAETDYLYFLADIHTGNIYYAEDYDEHLRLKEEYIDNNQ